jgi:uncharacterized protein YjbJ (UPF0337 family)
MAALMASDPNTKFDRHNVFQRTRTRKPVRCQKGMQMTTDDKADQARKSLIDSVKGNAKEIAGAVIGNDSLTAEGQLEQTAAKDRRAASAVQTEADAEAAEAERLANDAKIEGVDERIAADVRTSAEKQAIRDEQLAQERAAERAGANDAARAQKRIEADAQQQVVRIKADERDEVEAVAKDYVQEVDDHRRSVGEAEHTEAAADRLRARANEATEQHNLP